MGEPDSSPRAYQIARARHGSIPTVHDERDELVLGRHRGRADVVLEHVQPLDAERVDAAAPRPAHLQLERVPGLGAAFVVQQQRIGRHRDGVLGDLDRDPTRRPDAFDQARVDVEHDRPGAPSEVERLPDAEGVLPVVLRGDRDQQMVVLDPGDRIADQRVLVGINLGGQTRTAGGEGGRADRHRAARARRQVGLNATAAPERGVELAHAAPGRERPIERVAERGTRQPARARAQAARAGLTARAAAGTRAAAARHGPAGGAALRATSPEDGGAESLPPVELRPPRAPAPDPLAPLPLEPFASSGLAAPSG
jgi:hypothetical protein